MREVAGKAGAEAGPVAGAAPEASPGKSSLVEASRGLTAAPPGPGKAIRGGDPTHPPDAHAEAPGAGQGPQKQGQGGAPGQGGGAQAQPAPVTIASHTNAGPTFGPGGATMWHVRFSTTGRNGWIVQKVDSTITGTNAQGAPLTLAAIGITPNYYEGWSVDAHGTVSPSAGGDNDRWDQGPVGQGTKGTWETRATLHWIAGNATPGGMAAGTVPSAGILVSSTSAPPNLGPALLHRFARGTWDSTVNPPVDHGAAS